MNTEDTLPPLEPAAPPLADDRLVALALAVAAREHAGQTDKAGRPYLTHLLRVAHRVRPARPQTVAAALLHDVIEDCPVTAAQLLAEGIPARVVDGVLLLTRRDEVPADAYYAAIAGDEVALAVKTADIADNTDPRRVAELDRSSAERLRVKYAAARVALGIAG
ncbi:hypothetical protein GOHSU_27_00300 [Gordonia hirsuta DSM 44140 = NBRC 16056]|uniref:HD/PDEase domain-containing protein n=1 Tax=Gordonia hirsuta DSM 44140 = NBRC 16056 TaxID=1121927 RepID=L7LAE3_9ACTN|nr:HD domain-containing protein [Gordonia hirsuta]GAC57894.1 hypothetical protein GOHSU_27_00300 [Gordonia hirsuta DSM 44140 = NBRC 16056]